MATIHRISFKLALAQMRVEGGNKKGNLQRAVQMIGQAAQGGAVVVVLPEAMNVGWTHSSARTLADPIPDGLSCETLRQAAMTHRMYVCSGLVEKCDGRIYNAAVLIAPDGQILLHHRKINELDIAKDLYTHGERLQVCRAPLAVFGVMICADAFTPGQVLSRSLCQMGAEVILSPCSWAVPADHDNQQEPYGDTWRNCYLPVARDFPVWIAGASDVGWITDGPWKGRKCIGCSMVIAPGGREVLQGPYGPAAEQILYAEVDPVSSKCPAAI